MTKKSFVAEVTFKHMILIITLSRVWLNMIHDSQQGFEFPQLKSLLWTFLW